MARGTGLRGLTGIPARRGRIVRPLLQTPRRDIEEYLTAHGIPHVEDSTNAETDAARNRIRLDVLPRLESIHPGAAAGIARMSETLAEDEAFLASLAEEKACPSGARRSPARSFARCRGPSRGALLRAGSAENSRASGSTRCCALPPETATACWSFRDGASGGSSGSFGSARGTRRRWRSACFCPEKRSYTPGRWRISCERCAAGSEIQTSFNTFCFSCANICGKLSVASRAAGDTILLHRRGRYALGEQAARRSAHPKTSAPPFPFCATGRGLLPFTASGRARELSPRRRNRFIKSLFRQFRRKRENERRYCVHTAQ